MLHGRFRYLSLALLAVMSLALIAACSDDGGGDDGLDLPEPTSETPDGGNGGGPPAGDLTLTMSDIAFDQTELAATAGEAVDLAVVNEGVLEHDFTIDEIPAEVSGSGDIVVGGDQDVHGSLGPGASGVLTLTVSEAGSYTFYCSVEGHREAGMEGTLTVE
jgi:plastocyanin